MDGVENRISHIDVVFIAHGHLDHYGNLDLSEKAQGMASRVIVERHNFTEFVPVEDGMEIAERVKVVYTPGDTVGHASVVVNSVVTAGGFGIRSRIVLAGDAVISVKYFGQRKLCDI